MSQVDWCRLVVMATPVGRTWKAFKHILSCALFFAHTHSTHTHTICSVYSFFSETEDPVCHSVTWCPLKSRIMFNFPLVITSLGVAVTHFELWKARGLKAQMILWKVSWTSFFHGAEFCFYCQLSVGLLQSLPVQYFILNDPPSTNSPGEEVTSRVCLGF